MAIEFNGLLSTWIPFRLETDYLTIDLYEGCPETDKGVRRVF